MLTLGLPVDVQLSEMVFQGSVLPKAGQAKRNPPSRTVVCSLPYLIISCAMNNFRFKRFTCSVGDLDSSLL